MNCILIVFDFRYLIDGSGKASGFDALPGGSQVYMVQ